MKLGDVPKIPLAFAPTPVERLMRLGADLGIELFVKRDDYTGFGGGGNKVRKLEYLMADAVARGVKVLITTGGHQSNHARMTAAAARHFGMHPVLVLRGNEPSGFQGNLLLDRLFGAEIEFLDPDAYFDLIGPRMQAHADRARERGQEPYIMPVGGATPLGALGYASAVRELAEQFAALALPAPDVIVTAVGSGGTLAGIEIGLTQYWPGTKAIGIAVSGSAVPFPDRIAPMATEGAKLVGLDRVWRPEEIHVETGYFGEAYAVPSEAGNAAIKRLAMQEGLLLDPVYTGKGMAGLLGLVEDGTIPKGARVLFLHTGGSPALYPHAEQLAKL
ncbi:MULTISPECIES: 1-aminocyclopropane-1-carboxylate deaminase/D-cysteine desulfhydrase [Paracoccus]|uniref:D-cysteine desulfhydrase n=1 Tax=Paracoccus versutus TaxID=34007 RepID=A0A3D9XVL4_PARVE|nr:MULTISPECIES: D-cysteine desulfhydrase family protein [Paracoccus]MCJ1900139.1 D-cysteine desulfhydrase family protein [Paracoccus versutus]REF73163.1 D-cysteine desulfhydrase [Paracoccus versutus]WGR54939.1 D-cysteine desulfhydrase family protein [Paracoccus versutus]